MILRSCALAALLLTTSMPLLRSQEVRDESKAQSEKNPLPAIKRDKLPPATRPKLDPKKVQFVKEPVYVEVSEIHVGSDGESRSPDVLVVQRYLEEYFRRAGHPIVRSADDAVYRVRGSVRGEYNREIRFRDRVIAHRVRGSAEIAVFDKEGKELESHRLPETFREASLEEDRAFLTLQRYVASILWEDLFRSGKVFSNASVIELLAALTIQNEADFEPITAEQIVEKLADQGLEAVPYLLEALSDTSIVRVPAKYPGLERTGPSALKVFHIADKSLEEIFQKVSRMPLEVPSRTRFLVIKGWENEWRRFCTSYRESPNRKPAKEKAEQGTDGESSEGG